jgi:hypothetical protein
MNATPAEVYPAVHGSVRWEDSDPLRCLDVFGCASLTIRTGDNDAVYYHLHKEADGGWLLRRPLEDGSGFHEYALSESLDSCTCKDFRLRKREDGRCKHCKAVASALKKAGYCCRVG